MSKVTQEGQPCRKCDTPVVKVIPKKRDKKKAYWFAYYFKCPACGCMYMVEEAKITNPKANPRTDFRFQRKPWFKRLPDSRKREILDDVAGWMATKADRQEREEAFQGAISRE